MSKHKIELLSDCYVVVEDAEMSRIKTELKNAARNDQTVIVEGVDHNGNEFGFRSDSVVVWDNDVEAIEALEAE